MICQFNELTSAKNIWLMPNRTRKQANVGKPKTIYPCSKYFYRKIWKKKTSKDFFFPIFSNNFPSAHMAPIWQSIPIFINSKPTDERTGGRGIMWPFFSEWIEIPSARVKNSPSCRETLILRQTQQTHLDAGHWILSTERTPKWQCAHCPLQTLHALFGMEWAPM